MQKEKEDVRAKCIMPNLAKWQHNCRIHGNAIFFFYLQLCLKDLLLHTTGSYLLQCLGNKSDF